ncbi:multidrug effflux MFS transporter [soil metagenome]
MIQNKRQRFTIIFLLGLLSAIGPFSIDMYLPGFISIADDLHTSVDMVAYSLSSFFIGVCIGQMACGPLLDRFGRKRPLYLGLVIYIVSSYGCAVSPTVEWLIFWRFFQALGGCVGMVAPRAIVRDLFPLNENAKILSYLILILGVSPILAPTVGSYVIDAVGWNFVFIVLGMVTLLILIAVILWLPESKQPDPTFSLKPKPIIASFMKVAKDPQFYTYSLAGGIASSGLFAYLAGSPFIFMDLHGLSKPQYGLIFALIAGGLITSSQINTLVLRRFSSEQIMKVILILQSVFGVVLFVGSYFDVLGLYGLITFIFLFLGCQGFSFPNSAALAMAPFNKEAGSASALMGALQMGMGSLAAAAVGLMAARTAMPMTGVMAFGAVVGLIILLVGVKRIVPTQEEGLLKEV